jgi:DNA-binding transcriptional regulator YhcF (GntR family)
MNTKQEELARELDNAVICVARAADDLEQVNTFAASRTVGVVVTRESWEELQTALVAWRRSTQRLLASAHS